MTATYKKLASFVVVHKQELFLCLFILFAPLLVFIISILINDISKDIALRRIASIETSFNDELKMTLKKMVAAVNEGDINKYISNNDAQNTSIILGALTKKYNLSRMTAVNKEGVAVVRVPSPIRGDYVAQTTSWGRRSAKGENTTSVGITHMHLISNKDI